MDYLLPLTLKQKLGIIIKNYRRNEKLTQDELARQINCDQSVISRIEIGIDAIYMEIYELALQYFNINYVEQNKYFKKVIDQFMTALNVLDMKTLMSMKQTFYEIEDLPINILIQYRIIQIFYSYTDNDYQTCEEQISELEELVLTSDNQSQMLYLIMRLSVETILSNYQKALKTIDILENCQLCDQQIIAYYIGWFYYKFNNRSLALKYLVNALEKFEETNNYRRIFRVQTIIISLLVKEKNYHQAIYEIKKLLENLQKHLNLKEIFILYFLLGYCYYLLNEYDLAIDYFNQAIQIEDTVDKNHIYYYLLKIYDILDDVKKSRYILNRINNDDENSFGYKIIHLYLQSRIGKSIKYYQYIESEIVPLIANHYEKMEINTYIQELLEYYYDTQQYMKYHELSLKIIKFFA